MAKTQQQLDDEERERQRQQQLAQQPSGFSLGSLFSWLPSFGTMFMMVAAACIAGFAAMQGWLGDGAKQWIDGLIGPGGLKGLWTKAKAFFGDKDATDQVITDSTAEEARGMMESELQKPERGGFTPEVAKNLALVMAPNDSEWNKNKALLKGADGHYGMDGNVVVKILIQNPALATKALVAIKPQFANDPEKLNAIQLMINNPQPLQVLMGELGPKAAPLVTQLMAGDMSAMGQLFARDTVMALKHFADKANLADVSGATKDGLLKLKSMSVPEINALVAIKEKGIRPEVLLANLSSPGKLTDTLLNPERRAELVRAGLDNIAVLGAKTSPMVTQKNLAALVQFAEAIDRNATTPEARKQSYAFFQQLAQGMMQPATPQPATPQSNPLAALNPTLAAQFFSNPANIAAFDQFDIQLDRRVMTPQQIAICNAIHANMGGVVVREGKIDHAQSHGIAECLADPQAMAFLLEQMRKPPSQPKMTEADIRTQLGRAQFLQAHPTLKSMVATVVDIPNIGTLAQNPDAVVALMKATGAIRA